MKISGVRVFDGEGVLANQDVVVHDGVITQVTEAVAAPADVDGRGRTLLPGLFERTCTWPPAPRRRCGSSPRWA